MRQHSLLSFLSAVIIAWGAGAPIAQADGVTCTPVNHNTQQIVDMAGRKVLTTSQVNTIATVGSVPVLNGYLFALGAGEHIINGLPSRFTASNRWQLYSAVAPHLKHKTVLQGQAASEVNAEQLMQLAPDLVLSMNLLQIRSLEKTKAPALYLEWATTADIRQSIKILGCALQRQPQADAYLHYFDSTLATVHQTLLPVTTEAKPKVLYFNPHTMTTPLQIANWWINKAGGRSVTTDIPVGANTHYSHEQVLTWNPDILIVSAPEHIDAIYQDERFSKLSAVQHRQVYATPMGVHSWGQRTVEQPLTVLWAATLFHPHLFNDVDMATEVQRFYQQFFHYDPSPQTIHDILAGRTPQELSLHKQTAM